MDPPSLAHWQKQIVIDKDTADRLRIDGNKSIYSCQFASIRGCFSVFGFAVTFCKMSLWSSVRLGF
jgi:hypothetical protein